MPRLGENFNLKKMNQAAYPFIKPRSVPNAVQLSVIPAKAGIQVSRIYWVPAFAGTTN
jgi:hypothetical protein